MKRTIKLLAVLLAVTALLSSSFTAAFAAEGEVEAVTGATTAAKPESIAIKQGGKKTLRVGETLQLTAAVSPKAARGTAVKWTSSKKSVAAVDAKTGLVTAKKAGTARITAKAGGKSAAITITVKKPKELSGYFGKGLAASAKKISGMKRVKGSEPYIRYTNGKVSFAGYSEGAKPYIGFIEIKKSKDYALFGVTVGMKAEDARRLLKRYENDVSYFSDTWWSYSLIDDEGNEAWVYVSLKGGKVTSVCYNWYTDM